MKLLVDFFLVGGILSTILIIILLFKSKKSQLPHYILVVFFSTLLFLLVSAYSDLHEIEILYVASFFVSDVAVWLLGPLLLLYVKSLFNSGEKLLKRHLIHFTPALLYLTTITIPILIYYFFEILVNPYVETIIDSGLLFFVEDIYLFVYLILSLRIFSNYRKAMKSNYSNLDEKDLQWVKNLLMGALVVISIEFGMSLTELMLGEFDWDLWHLTYIALVILVGYLGYHGVNQSRVLLPNFLEDEKISEEKEKTHHLSNTCEEDLKKLKSEFERVIVEEQPYLDEELTLGKLAQLIPTTDKKLSALLNQYMDTTFYDIINAYRVEAVKEKMVSLAFSNYTLLGIAFECGFKSKSSFNRIFKKETGFSPSEYRKSALTPIEETN